MKKLFFVVLCSVFVLSVMPAFASETSVDVGTSTETTAIQGQDSHDTTVQVFAPIFEGSTPKRGGHIPPDVSYPSPVFAPNQGDKGPNYESVVAILRYHDKNNNGIAIFTREELETLASSTDCSWLNPFQDRTRGRKNLVS